MCVCVCVCVCVYIRVFKTKRYKFLSRKHIIEKNCSDKSYRFQKDLFTDFISLTFGSLKLGQGHVDFLKHPTFDSRI